MSQQKCNTPSTNMHKLKQKNQLQHTKKITTTTFNNYAFIPILTLVLSFQVAIAILRAKSL